MSWHWVPDRTPTEDAGLSKTYPTQGEAESWLGEFYPDLLEVGVTAVTLYEEDRLVYGPMRLDTEGS
ncbi:MAG: hypothetical protein ABWY56_16015 [Propionibacteriaceae bacterium]